ERRRPARPVRRRGCPDRHPLGAPRRGGRHVHGPVPRPRGRLRPARRGGDVAARRPADRGGRIAPAPPPRRRRPAPGPPPRAARLRRRRRRGAARTRAPRDRAPHHVRGVHGHRRSAAPGRRGARPACRPRL
ncbi:MAG: hypothetical protein AVDCRST_MAG53-514, partial [uncultured Solirubrobacteraceae bacterium]